MFIWRFYFLLRLKLIQSGTFNNLIKEHNIIHNKFLSKNFVSLTVFRKILLKKLDSHGHESVLGTNHFLNSLKIKIELIKHENKNFRIVFVFVSIVTFFVFVFVSKKVFIRLYYNLKLLCIYSLK